MSIWEKFDKKVDLAGLENEVKEAEENGGDFPEIPHGKYEVALKSIELVETKKEPVRPMIKMTFKVLAGKFKGQNMWVNQMADTGFKLKLGTDFVNSMKPANEVKFSKERGYAGLEEDLFNAAKHIKENFEFVLNYDKNDKGYDTYKIDEVFEVE